MLELVYAFGEVTCYVEVSVQPIPHGGDTYTSHAYVIEEEGRALRYVGDRHGNPIEFTGSDADVALVRVAVYLERRFGPLGDLPVLPEGGWSARPINEPPLRDERATDEQAVPRGT